MSMVKPYVNVHCHGAAGSAGEVRISNLFAGSALPADGLPKYCSIGIHPWFIESTDLAAALAQMLDVIAQQNCLAVGELGLDRVRGPRMDLQKEVMEKQLDVARECALPLIVHCVRAYSDLLQLHRERSAHVPWVLHGFHGSPEVAEQCIAKGMYLSLGPSVLAHPDRTRKLLDIVPMSRIFLETDEDSAEVPEMYRTVCAAASIEETALRERIAENFELVFGEAI